MNIGNFLKEANGDESSVRLICYLVVAAIIGTWSYVSITTKAMAPLDLPTVLALLGPIGFKVMQKKHEAQENQS
jgi:hypothetical protein